MEQKICREIDGSKADKEEEGNVFEGSIHKGVFRLYDCLGPRYTLSAYSPIPPRKMALTKDDVRHVAKLARLQLTDEEIDTYTGQLASIFEHLDKLSEVDTEGVEETSQVNGLTNVMRADEVKPSLDREAVLETSERDNTRGMIKVRKSI